MKKSFFSLILAILNVTGTRAYESPTMGWSSWNTYGFQISENIIKANADALHNLGFQDAGYIYLNIDDGFFGGRDAEGHLLIHPERFPNGMCPVVDYIHSLGLKAGIYSDAGENTCASFWGGDKIGEGVGLYGHDQEDIDLYFKTLNFDFIKVDYCGGNPNHNKDHLSLPEQERYTAIWQAIKNTGRTDVRMNVCRWAFPGTWVHDVATSWRTTEDIYLGWNSIKGILAQNLYLSAYATEGKFNDMDMLEVGRGLTEEEDKTHFGMWCILSSPLIIGCDLTTVPATAKALMLNPELIALNQDPLALQAYVAKKQDGGYVLVKDVETLHGTTRAVAFYNPTDAAITLDVSMTDIELGGQVQVRDLFLRADMPAVAGQLSTTVPAHGTRIYRLQAEKRYERSRYEAETAWLDAYQELSNNQAVETAIYEEAAYCSGGAKAGWLGKSEKNDLQWRNVYSRDGGRYTMTLTYICGESRNATVSVNGNAVQTLSLNSGGWDKPASTTLTITLQPGDNLVRLSNASGWMPDIDSMVLEREGSLDLCLQELDGAIAQAQQLLATELPDAWAALLQETVEQALQAEQTREALLQATARVTACVGEVKAMQAGYAQLLALTTQCSDVADSAAESNALTAFRTAIAEALTEAPAATTHEELQRTLTQLHTAAVSFLTSPEAQPAEGKTLEMTLLIANSTMEAGVAGWAGAPTFREGVGEYWNTAFNLSQTIRNLQPGHYTLTAQALYRTTANDGGAAYKAGTETIPATLFAGEATAPIPSLYSFPYPTEEGVAYADTEVKKGYANSMHAAALCFAEGAYTCNVEQTLTTATSLLIGLKCTTQKNDCWCCFDNFRLFYHGNPDTETPETSIQPTAPTAPHPTATYTLSGIPIRSRQQHGVAVGKSKKMMQ